MSEYLIALVVTILGGIVTGLLTRRSSQQSLEVSSIAELIREATGARRSQAVERAAEMLAQDALPRLERTAIHAGDTVQLVVRVEDTTPDQETWPLVEKLVNGYHAQALGQASIQFWFSIAAAVAGFALILWIGFSASSANTSEVLLRSVPGAVLEGVAALFFKQASETRQRATELYDRLREDNKRIQAVSIVDAIDNPQLRAIVQAQLALHVAGLSSSPLDLAPLLTSLKSEPSAPVEAVPQQRTQE